MIDELLFFPRQFLGPEIAAAWGALEVVDDFRKHARASVKYTNILHPAVF
jgi:hypothetical protein